MTAKDKVQRATAGVAFDGLYKYLIKNPQENLVKLVDKVESFAGGTFPERMMKAFREGAQDPNNVWTQLAMRVLRDVDQQSLKKMMLAIGLGVINGTREVRKNREIYGCNLPFIILFDPTSACNMHCKGCWSGEYGHKHSLTYEEMESIVSQSHAFGSRFYMLTGGEPLLRKKDILKLCEAYPDCAFLAYTNSTLVDQQLCDDIKRVGNLTLALSIEGTPESNDARRGAGSYDTIMKAMDLLKANKCLFGMSVCYTRDNIPAVTSDEFMQKMVEKGVVYSLYFNYMPVGSDASADLIPTPAQRKYMYTWLRKTRNSQRGNPLFVMDFQNDAEYVGGCIAGGRNYFHINSAGDMEPCVFIHYSDSNIRTHSLVDALRRPLFQQFYHNQPFNDNHLRPCPLLENPEYLRKMVAESGAKSTDLCAPESAETVCARCDAFAQAWAPEADALWNSTKHPNPKTQFYRDTPEGKAALAAQAGCTSCAGCTACAGQLNEEQIKEIVGIDLPVVPQNKES